MSVLSLFPSRIRFVDENGLLTKEAVRALTDIYSRIGGATAPTITELSMSDDEDSGLDEFKHENSKHIQELNLMPIREAWQYADPLLPVVQEHAGQGNVDPVAQAHAEINNLQTELAGLREEVGGLRQQLHDLQLGTIHDGNS